MEMGAPEVGGQGGGFIANPPDTATFGEDWAGSTTLPESWQGPEYVPYTRTEPTGGNIPDVDMSIFGGPGPGPIQTMAEEFGGPGPGPDAGTEMVSFRNEADAMIGSDGLPFAGEMPPVDSRPIGMSPLEVREYETIHNPQYKSQIADEMEMMELKLGHNSVVRTEMAEEAPMAEIGGVDDPDLLQGTQYSEKAEMVTELEAKSASIEARMVKLQKFMDSHSVEARYAEARAETEIELQSYQEFDASVNALKDDLVADRRVVEPTAVEMTETPALGGVRPYHRRRLSLSG